MARSVGPSASLSHSALRALSQEAHGASRPLPGPHRLGGEAEAGSRGPGCRWAKAQPPVVSWGVVCDAAALVSTVRSGSSESSSQEETLFLLFFLFVSVREGGCSLDAEQPAHTARKSGGHACVVRWSQLSEAVAFLPCSLRGLRAGRLPPCSCLARASVFLGSFASSGPSHPRGHRGRSGLRPAPAGERVPLRPPPSRGQGGGTGLPCPRRTLPSHNYPVSIPAPLAQASCVPPHVATDCVASGARAGQQGACARPRVQRAQHCLVVSCGHLGSAPWRASINCTVQRARDGHLRPEGRCWVLTAHSREEARSGSPPVPRTAAGRWPSQTFPRDGGSRPPAPERAERGAMRSRVFGAVRAAFVSRGIRCQSV